VPISYQERPMRGNRDQLKAVLARHVCRSSGRVLTDRGTLLDASLLASFLIALSLMLIAFQIFFFFSDRALD
jgi:hypothetical protein